jgi:hypothetical protein
MNALKKVEKLFKSFQKKDLKHRFELKTYRLESANIDRSATSTDNYCQIKDRIQQT